MSLSLILRDLGQMLSIELTDVMLWRNGDLIPKDKAIYSRIFTSFHGYTFIAEYVPFFSYVEEHVLPNGSLHLVGFEVQLVNTVADALDFNIDFQRQSEDKWGSIDSTTGEMTGMVGDVLRGKVDFAFAGLGDFLFRRKFVDYTSAVDYECIRFVVPQGSEKPKWIILYMPFTWNVWIGIICCIIGVIYTLYIIAVISEKVYSCDEHFKNIIVISVIAAVFQQAIAKDSRRFTSSTRIITYIYWVFTIILTVGYRSELVSFLIAPLYNKPINTLDELAASDLTTNMYNYGGGGINHYFNSSVNPAEIEIWKRMTFVDSIPKAVKRLSDTSKFAVCDTDTLMQWLIASEYSNPITGVNMIHPIKDCFSPYKAAWAVSKQSNFKDSFNRIIERMEETGHIQKWKRDILLNVKISNLKKRSESGQISAGNKKEPLSFNSLQCGFVAWSMCVCLSLVVQFAELFMHKLQIRKSNAAVQFPT